MNRCRYWLVFGGYDTPRIRAETTREHYRATYAKYNPNEHGDDFDPPDDPYWYLAGRGIDPRFPNTFQRVGGEIWDPS